MPSSRPLVSYHHPCTDGFTAAWAAWRKFGLDADYLPATHISLPPDVSGREIHLLDHCYPRTAMERLCRDNQVIVHDHHDSVRAIMHGLPGRLNFHSEQAGAEIAWRYFHPGVAVPPLVQHVSAADLGRSDETSLSLQAVLRITPHDFDRWDALSALSPDEWERLVHQGRALLENLRHEARDLAQHATACVLNGHEGLAVNGPWWLADAVGLELFGRSGTYGLLWHARGERVHVSLRSGEGGIDVALLAERFGGGGRRRSAGFRSTYRDMHPLITRGSSASGAP